MASHSKGFGQITGIDAAAKGLTAAAAALTPANTIPADTIVHGYVLCQAEAQNVRWRDDGTDPTAAVGNLLLAGESMDYRGKFAALKFIAAVAGASVNVTFYSN